MSFDDFDSIENETKKSNKTRIAIIGIIGGICGSVIYLLYRFNKPFFSTNYFSTKFTEITDQEIWTKGQNNIIQAKMRLDEGIKLLEHNAPLLIDDYKNAYGEDSNHDNRVVEQRKMREYRDRTKLDLNRIFNSFKSATERIAHKGITDKTDMDSFTLPEYDELFDDQMALANVDIKLINHVEMKNGKYLMEVVFDQPVYGFRLDSIKAQMWDGNQQSLDGNIIVNNLRGTSQNYYFDVRPLLTASKFEISIKDNASIYTIFGKKVFGTNNAVSVDTSIL